MANSTSADAGINIINSQGAQVYVLDKPATAWTDCTAAAAAIKAGKKVGCPQSLGDISETRSMTEYKCLSSNASTKALGAISRGSLEIGLLLDPKDTEGQKALKDAFKSNTQVVIGVELPDMPSGGKNGTIYWFIGAISGVSIGIAMDSAVTYTVTVEVASDLTECAAA